MRPLSKPSPASYLAPAMLTFTGANATKIQAVLGTSTPTLDACLNLWLRVIKAKKRKPLPNGFAAWNDAAKIIQGRVEEIYKEAAEDLISELGEYCSYCESPITGLLEVEHILSKSEFPTLSTAWSNFLLACGPCNNCKGNTPTRQMVRRWLAARITNEAQCEGEVHRRYYWPDRFPDSYQALPVDLFYDVGSGNWQQVSLPDATSVQNRLVSVDIPSRTVRADLPSVPQMNVPVCARVIPRVIQASVSGVTLGVTPKGTSEIIDLCGLNTTKSYRVAYDRRGLNRTRAWFSAVETLKTLASSPNQADFDRTWSLVGRTAAGIGFFSVWLRVFSMTTDPSGQKLDQRFVREYAGMFAGTNTSQLP
ncbi:HNH endonuclease [Bremerella alba]|uniref:HNH domain-containing protein n=1 Tax=Bremerella alba TaxID=980252 RepID=A0A7V9A863_9BACT|nr:HNH endonuclease [Bremerella alba]MBA2116092.1 hypothetical protein [Bremerella alba]